MRDLHMRLPFFICLIFSTYALADGKATREDFDGEYAHYQQLHKAGQSSDSLIYAKRSYEMGKSLFGLDSKNTAALAYNYGLNLMEVGKNEEAEQILIEAVSLYENAYGEDSVELIPVLIDLGHSVPGISRGKIQIGHFTRALELAESQYGEESFEYAQRSVEVGATLFLKTKSRNAKEYLYNGHKILEKKLGEKSPRAGWAAFNIGKYELATGHYDDAVLYFNKALASFSVPDQPSNQFELATHGFLVQAYEKLDKSDLATSHCLAIGRMTPASEIQDYQPLVKIAPEYPAEAIQAGREGYVILAYEVDDFGFVRNPKVVDQDGPRSFAYAATKAAEKFRYAPRFEDGKAVATEGVLNRFTFKLVD